MYLCIAMQSVQHLILYTYTLTMGINQNIFHNIVNELIVQYDF